MLRKILLTLLLVVVFGIQPILWFGLEEEDSHLVIGILQTCAHPALDSARMAFVHKMEKEFGADLHIRFLNAEGNAQLAKIQAKSLTRDRSVLAYCAIGTMAAEALVSYEKDLPVFVVAVTDPDALGFLYPGTNVCGASDSVDLRKTVQMLKVLLPEVRKVAVLYNPEEANSIKQLKELRHSLHREGLVHIEVGASQDEEVVMAVKTVCHEVDAILVPTDNLFVKAMPQVASLALNANVPVIACDPASVEAGALAARGVDYAECGAMAARNAIRVLKKGEHPDSLPMYCPDLQEVHVNDKVMAALGIKVPRGLKAKAVG